MGDATETIQIRFRSTNGDVGPFTFTEEQTIQECKDKLFAEWPKGMYLALKSRNRA